MHEIFLPELPKGLLTPDSPAKQIWDKYGLPQRFGPSREAWKYTYLGKLAKTKLTFPLPSPLPSPIPLEKTRIPTFQSETRITFLNGKLQENSSQNITLDPHPISLDDARPLVERPLAALNLASQCPHWRLEIPASGNPLPLIHCLFLYHHDSEKTALVQTQLSLFLAPNAQATIFETHIGTGDYWANVLLNVHLSENAQCEHILLQDQSLSCCHFAGQSARLEKNARYQHISAQRGGQLVRQEVSVNLSGENAECILNGAYYVDQNRHIDNDTYIGHHVANCRSNETYKGVIEDSGCGVFHGKIFVAQDAQKTKGYQMSRALLLSDKGKAYHKPELEIYADDVQCSHGTTVGMPDAEQVFYMRSRGLNEAQAQRLLVEAFLSEALTCSQPECFEILIARMLP